MPSWTSLLLLYSSSGFGTHNWDEIEVGIIRLQYSNWQSCSGHLRAFKWYVSMCFVHSRKKLSTFPLCYIPSQVLTHPLWLVQNNSPRHNTWLCRLDSANIFGTDTGTRLVRCMCRDYLTHNYLYCLQTGTTLVCLPIFLSQKGI